MSLAIAVAGLAHGKSYLRLADNHPRTELVAVVDKSEKTLQRVQDKYEAKSFPSLEQMLEADLADAVVLALPTPFHAKTTSLCLNAGLHVLQEKPLCRTQEEARQIERAVEKSQKVFQVGYEVRSSQLHQAIMDHIERGDLGRITNIWYNQHTLAKRETTEWRNRRDNLGGKLFDCACHYLDLMAEWAGDQPTRLVALGNQLGRTGPCDEDIPESAVISIEYANGVRGTYNFGERNECEDDASFGIVGTTGRIMGNPWLPDGAGSYELRTDGGARHGELIFDGNLCSRGHLGFKEQFDGFVQTILDDAPNPCSLKNALTTHNTLEAIDRSLRSGQVEQVQQT